MGKVSKVVVCGLKGIGKTTLLEQLIYGNYEKQVRQNLKPGVVAYSVDVDICRYILLYYAETG
jgi:GTPase SAR1 family protein